MSILANKGVLPAGGATILLVDDEEMFLNCTYHLLTILGYKVIPALSPQKALSIAMDSRQKLDLLMTDLIMPGMNGSELANHVTAIRPEISILYVTGYSEAELNLLSIHVGINLLKKPHDIVELQSMLANCFRPKCRFEKQKSL